MFLLSLRSATILFLNILYCLWSSFLWSPSGALMYLFNNESRLFMEFSIPGVIQGLASSFNSFLLAFLRGICLSRILYIESLKLLRDEFESIFSGETTLVQFIFMTSATRSSFTKFFLRLKMLCFLGGPVNSSGRSRNWGRWSDIEKVKFPEIPAEKLGSFEKMLSIRVFDVEVMRVGRVMWGD